MTDDVARAILTAGLVVVLPIAIRARRAAATGEPLDRKAEGWFILLTLRPVGLAQMVGLLAYLVSPASMSWSAMPLPGWLRWAGVPLGVFGAFLIARTMWTLGKNLTDTVAVRAEAELVTSGPYAYIRHPFYVAWLVSSLANALVAANGFLLATGLVGFALIAWRARTEEAKLVERFGDAYRDYAARTARFVPGIW